MWEPLRVVVGPLAPLPPTACRRTRYAVVDVEDEHVFYAAPRIVSGPRAPRFRSETEAKNESGALTPYRAFSRTNKDCPRLGEHPPLAVARATNVSANAK
jgi:hypothetical protein